MAWRISSISVKGRTTSRATHATMSGHRAVAHQSNLTTLILVECKDMHHSTTASDNEDWCERPRRRVDGPGACKQLLVILLISCQPSFERIGFLPHFFISRDGRIVIRVESRELLDWSRS